MVLVSSAFTNISAAPVETLVDNALSCADRGDRLEAINRYIGQVKTEEIRLYNSLPYDNLNKPGTFDNVESIANLWRYIESKCNLRPWIYTEISGKLGYEIHELSPKLNVPDSLLKFTAPQAKEAGSKLAEKYLAGTGKASVKDSKISSKPVCLGKTLCTLDKVTKIVDGDTIYTDKYKLRLSLVNSPEKNQKGFAEAKSFTASLCKVGTMAQIDQDDKQKTDKYGRIVAKVTCSDKNLNQELLIANHAKILKNYCLKSEFSKESWATKYGC